MVRAAYARPNCTHITMDIVHVSALCDVCHQEPSMGWVYECQQDRVQHLNVQEKSKISLDENDTSVTSTLKTLGFSHSIILQAAAGMYTDAQLDILKRQKIGVMQLVDAHMKAVAADKTEDSDEDGPMHPNITVRRKRILPFKRRVEAAHFQNAKCAIRCCHVCP